VPRRSCRRVLEGVRARRPPSVRSALVRVRLVWTVRIDTQGSAAVNFCESPGLFDGEPVPARGVGRRQQVPKTSLC